MKIVWTKHAEERQKEWERERGSTRQEVEEAIMKPEQVVYSDQGICIAQVRTENGLLWAPFIEEKGARKVLMVYWTSKIDKYWQEKH